MKTVILNEYKRQMQICLILFIPVVFLLPACNKILDTHPVTQLVRSFDTTSTISATDAENDIAGLYYYYKADGQEFTVFDRQFFGDVMSDNCYAGGDNGDMISLDDFQTNSLNSIVNRDWVDAYGIIGRANIAIHDISRSVDPALSSVRKNQMLGEARFIRAFTYFDLVQRYGGIPLLLAPPNTKSAQALFNSTIVSRTSVDSVYDAILNDLWFAAKTVRDVGASPSKYVVSTGTVNAALAKVYATIPKHNWDSVLYYCDQVIPNYQMLPQFSYLWDNNHKNNSEAIWEINYDGWNAGDHFGNWSPSICVGGTIGNYQGGGWKKFYTPTNDLINDFMAEGDSIRLNNSVTFLNISGQWTDKYWNTAHYPFLTKFNDPSGGINDFYVIRLPDILLLKARALVGKGDIPGALTLVNEVRARVNLSPKIATNADDVKAIILNERRLELAFEGIRWLDLLRTGEALTTMNNEKDGNGNNLNYNVQAYQLLWPIPQQQIDLNPKLTQNTGY